MAGEIKKWYLSKTLWTNVVAVVGIVMAGTVGIELSPESSVAILGVVNFILRLITKEPLGW